MLALESLIQFRPVDRDSPEQMTMVWSVPPGWRQGRGAWGGLVATAVVRAAVAAEGTSRPVRAVNLAFLAPVLSGDVVVTVTELRRGSATSTWRVEITDAQSPGIIVHGLVILGDARTTGIDEILRRDESDAQMPSVAPWRDQPSIDIAPPLGPEFSSQLIYRPIQGFPYSGSADDVSCWISYGDVEWDAAALIGLVDAMWPIAIVRITEPRPMATINFTASLLVDPATVAADEPLLHVSRSICVYDGYSTEHRQLWTADGRLAVDNPQVIAVIR
ncbi:MAG: acyl-CoA thioesterase domain-containing protein [Candidatus Nanopelagicales bacterium]